MKVLVALCMILVAGAQAQNLVEKLTEIGATTLVDFIEAADLTETISTLGPITLFAPTNQAFANLPDDVREALETVPGLLAQVILSHGILADIGSDALVNDLVAETIPGSVLRFNLYNGAFAVNGAPIVNVDQRADNGVIHVVEYVLFPPSVENAAEYIDLDLDHNVLSSLLFLTGLDTVLAGPGPFTLFAPTDEGFATVPDDVLDDLLNDLEKLVDVLLYHVVSGTYHSTGLSEGQAVTTLQGGDVTISLSAETVNGIAISYPDYDVTNGVVHSIAGVLIPSA